MKAFSLVGVSLTRKSSVFFVATFLSFMGAFLWSSPTFAALQDNSRLNYGDANAYCNGGWAKGMVWVSNNESDYYSESIVVAENASSAQVSIRGAVNSCNTNFSPGRDMYAVDVSSPELTGLSSTSFYRGYVSGTFNWTTQGSKLYANLNVQGVAVCSTTNLTGSSSAEVIIKVNRRQQQYEGGKLVYDSQTVGTEEIKAVVKRTCPTFDYDLYPSITNITDGSITETPESGKLIVGSINNVGPTISRQNTDWRLTQVVYAPGATIPQKAGGVRVTASNILPCIFFTGEVACDDSSGTGNRPEGYPVNSPQSHQANLTINAYEVGTRICFALSVKQYDETTDGWRHSDLRCATVGKRPKVSVLGGDLYTGRSLIGLSAVSSGRIITSNTRNSAGLFGSWGEYALIPSGPVTNMSSGSGTVNGNQTNLNLLTFANQGVSTNTCGTSLGCFTQGGSMPNIVSRFSTSSTTSTVYSGSLSGLNKGVYKAGTSLTIDASTIEKGKWIVINAPTTNVVINGDIRYADGPFVSSTEIPQVVIIAKNITINDGVENVDAWLIAPGIASGSSMTDGVIRTCNQAPSVISAAVCDKKLTVNGPVVANRLVMLRTGGAQSGGQAGDPAEVFNFRPDAYLWAVGQAETGGRVTTVSTKELPPRY